MARYMLLKAVNAQYASKRQKTTVEVHHCFAYFILLSRKLKDQRGCLENQMTFVSHG